MTTHVPIERVDDVKKSNKPNIQTTSPFTTHLILYNHHTKKLNKKLTQPLHMIINPKHIAKNLSKNYPHPPSPPFNHPLKSLQKHQIQSQHINPPKQLLAQQRYSKSHPLKLNILTYHRTPQLPKIPHLIQSQPKNPNLHIQLPNLHHIQPYLKNKHTSHLSIYTYLSLPPPHTPYFFNTPYLPDRPLNKPNYTNT
ncbi:periplasmic substrate-binding domain-containing protein, partial [Staphylococcus epidermidis]